MTNAKCGKKTPPSHSSGSHAGAEPLAQEGDMDAPELMGLSSAVNVGAAKHSVPTGLGATLVQRPCCAQRGDPRPLSPLETSWGEDDKRPESPSP